MRTMLKLTARCGGMGFMLHGLGGERRVESEGHGLGRPRQLVDGPSAGTRPMWPYFPAPPEAVKNQPTVNGTVKVGGIVLS